MQSSKLSSMYNLYCKSPITQQFNYTIMQISKSPIIQQINYTTKANQLHNEGKSTTQFGHYLRSNPQKEDP
jgi:hypothetical protein